MPRASGNKVPQVVFEPATEGEVLLLWLTVRVALFIRCVRADFPTRTTNA
ncbi:MAG: hypothetical protein ACYCPW_11675 [Nitrososphaerales archaeon]